MYRHDGRLVPIAGKSQCGKSAWVMRDIKRKKHQRVLAWDPEDQWSAQPGFKRITSKAQLLQAIQQKGPQKLAYVVGGDIKEEFDFCCGCAFWWARFRGGCAYIAEEVADVTSTSKAPGNWGICLRRGLKYGMYMYPISQRWAEADKTALGNPSMVVCVQMTPPDARYMSKKLGIPLEPLAAIRKVETATTVTCNYLEFDCATDQYTADKMVFQKKAKKI